MSRGNAFSQFKAEQIIQIHVTDLGDDQAFHASGRVYEAKVMEKLQMYNDMSWLTAFTLTVT